MSGLAPIYRDDPRLQPLIGPGGPFEVEDIVVDGVPLRSFVGGLRTIVDSFRAGAAHADKDHIVYGTERHTFGDVIRRALGVAHELRDTYGVRVGDRVAISMRNLPEYVTAFWGAAVLGAIVVPLNSWWTGPELAYALGDADAKVAFLDAERLDRVLSVRDRVPGVALVAVRSPALPDDVLSIDELAASDPIGVDELVQLEPDDPILILYTSGTTGKPKGALLTNRNMTSSSMNMGFMGTRGGILSGAATRPGPALQTSTLASGPLFHIGGIAGIVAGPAGGVKLVMMHRWNADEAISLAISERVTNLGGVPTIARQLLEHPRFHELADLRGVPLGGAAVPPDLPRMATDRLGSSVQLLNGYGLTETTAAVVTNVGAEYVAHPDSVGIPNLTADVRIEDLDGTVLGTGEVGEICVRSPQVVKGYWNDVAATKAAFVGGWFHSGDLGYVDDEGFIHVVDRLKDVVIRGGENVYCAEVEAALFEHPDIAEVSVVGIAEPMMGERVCAVVVPRTGTELHLGELRVFAAERLAGFKCPEALWTTSELPKTATGKIAKPELRAALTAAGGTGVERTW